MINRKLILHVGFAKTGSSFIQQNFLGKIEGVHYLGKNINPNRSIQLARSSMIKKNSIEYNPKRALNAFKNELKHVAESKTLLLSEEDYSTFKFIDPILSINRLASIFKEIEIVLVIREPLSWIESTYFWRLQNKFPETFVGFEKWLMNQLKMPRVHSSISEIFSKSIIEAFENVRGVTKVHLLPYEQLTKNSEQYFLKWAEILNTKLDPHFLKESVEVQSSSRNKKRISDKQYQYFLDFGKYNPEKIEFVKFRRKVGRFLENEGLNEWGRRVKKTEDYDSFLKLEKKFVKELDSTSKISAVYSDKLRKLIHSKTEESLNFIDAKYKLELEKFGYRY